MKNFHRGTHELPIVPILIATNAIHVHHTGIEWAADYVATPDAVGVQVYFKFSKAQSKYQIHLT